MQTFTTNISAPLTFDKNNPVFRVSIKANGGTVEIEGNIAKFGDLDSAPVTLTDGQAVVLEATPVNGVQCTVTPGTGTADIMVFFN